MMVMAVVMDSGVHANWLAQDFLGCKSTAQNSLLEFLQNRCRLWILKNQFFLFQIHL